LFSEYDYCLNLGGFFQYFFRTAGWGRARRMILTAVNYVFNHFMRTIGRDYDKDGLRARSGKVHETTLYALNNLPFYKKSGSKSLGREWVEEEVLPLINSFGLSLEDALATHCEHVALQTAQHVHAGAPCLGDRWRCLQCVPDGAYGGCGSASNIPHTGCIDHRF